MKLQFSAPLQKEEPISFIVQRSKRRRRTMMISISKEGGVVVSVPMRTSQQEIERFAFSKAGWVRKRLQIVAQRPKHKSLSDFILEGAVLYLGEKLSVQIKESKLLKKKGFCFLDNDTLLVEIPESQQGSGNHYAEQAVREWYHAKAVELFQQRAEFFAKQIGVQFKVIKIGQHTSQWGSCTRNGTIRLNWFIMMTRPELIDYLIVHELCHLRHMNHSEKYWKEVGKILPDYKKLRARLREFERQFPLC